MLLVILQAIDEGVAHLACAREIATVVTIAPDPTAAAAVRGVEEAVSPYREALHPTRERIAIVGFDDEMQVIVLGY